MEGTFVLEAQPDTVQVTLYGPWGTQTLSWPLSTDLGSSQVPARALLLWFTLATQDPKRLQVQHLEVHENRYRFQGIFEGVAVEFVLDSEGRPLWIQTEGERLEIQAYNGQQPIAIHYEMGGGTLDLKIQSSENEKHR